jgi:quercetin dioxygenase-like cupin family protein
VPELLNGPGGVASEELNATIMEWAAGHATPEHVNDERDVLLVVLRGSAVVEIDGAGFPREAGEALVIEKGARRRIVAGPDGARVLTAHRRRPGLMPASRSA